MTALRSWTFSFSEMEEEWKAVERQRIHRWSETLEGMAAEKERLVAEGRWLAGPSDFLGVIGKDRDEMVHTRLLGWLLDPTGRHHLGSAVLRGLLDHVSERREGSAPQVREVSVSHRRAGREADLVVWGRDFTLVIEIKVDAIEQPSQCEDLYRNYGRETCPLFVFLTPSGRAPETAVSLQARRAFKAVSWPTILRIVESTYRTGASSASATASDNVRSYMLTLREQFG